MPSSQQDTSVGARLKEYERREVDRILAACTQCGKCFEVCPMTKYSTVPATDGKRVVPGVLEVLRGKQGTPEALGWIEVCARSGVCIPACPEDVNPKMMMRLARMTARGGLAYPAQVAVKEDPDYFKRIRAFARLQLSDDELKEWT